MQYQKGPTLQTCRLDNFTYDPETGEIRSADRSTRLRHKTNLILQYLLEHAGEPVSRDTLFEVGWQQSVLQSAAINKVIAEIRTAFDDDAKNPAYLKTIPKLGYQWVGPAPQVIEAPATETIAPMQPAEAIRGREAKLNVRLIALIVSVGIALFAWWIWPRHILPEPSQRIAFLPLINQTASDRMQPFVAGLPDSVGKQLATLGFTTTPFSEVQANLPHPPSQLDLAPGLFARLATNLKASEVVVASLEKQAGQLLLNGKLYTRNQAPQPFQITAEDGDQLGIKWARTLTRMLAWRQVKQQFAVLQPQAPEAQLYYWDGLQQLLNGQVKQARTSLGFGLEIEPKQIGLNFFYKEAALQDMCRYRELFLPPNASCENLIDQVRLDPLLESSSVSWVSQGERLGLLGDVVHARMDRLSGFGDRAAGVLERTPTKKTPYWLMGLWFAERAAVAAEQGQSDEAEDFFELALRCHRQAKFVYTQAGYLAALAELAAKQGKSKATEAYRKEAKAVALLLAIEP